MSYKCPNCGTPDTVEQNVKQGEILHLDDNGEPEQVEKHDAVEVTFQQCGDCGREMEA